MAANLFLTLITAQDHMKEVDQVIQAYMAEQGCKEVNARAAYDGFMQQVWQPALRILDGMMKVKTGERFTAPDFPTNN